MKFLSWMQSNKLHGRVKFQNKSSNSNPSIEEREETSPSLPLGLLSIGTFGNNVLRTNKTDVENVVVDARSPGKETEDIELREIDDEMKEKIGLMIGDDEKHNPKSIVKRSVSFLVKKVFVCGGGGFAPPQPPPNFMDTPQDATMKKILRMMLHKKIYPKSSSQTASLKRFIKEKERRDKRNEEEE
ncbi:uncharacterized protein LOC111790378 [Cucurbita pepo subsp. pepo]|uniref:uncharacterized protein LOC111790378 n=1 Tax=Cucurbita pepo subsp. pepo TaxID=3664 RepID=UPI000C9D84DF|nr:uncharacterized protein LOC111790378 [Cucurbita pepo subsp. pepo]